MTDSCQVVLFVTLCEFILPVPTCLRNCTVGLAGEKWEILWVTGIQGCPKYLIVRKFSNFLYVDIDGSYVDSPKSWFLCS